MSTRARSRSRGYNIVEVMAAMAVFAVGASGVIAMQKTSVQASYDARALDVATSLTRTWQERLTRDARHWKTPGTNGLVTSRYLNDLGNSAWHVPATTGSDVGLESSAFDLLGRDIPPVGDASQPQLIFCTQIRVTAVQPQGGVSPSTGATLLRAEVRVMWPRANATPLTNCDDDNANRVARSNAESGLTPFHVLSTITTIRGSF